MKLSNRQSGILTFVNRTMNEVARIGAVRVVCKNADVVRELIRVANARRIFVVQDGLKLTLAKGK